MKVDLSPAQLERRIWAGALDTFIVLALCAAYFLIPVMTLGVVLPMWGVLAAIIGYSVIPLAVFKQTLGMRLFGLELVSKTGHAVGLGDVLFRELIGRGFFPAAFLFNLLFGYVAMMLGYARFAMPSGLQGLFFLASMFAVALAVLGHFLVLTAKDRRGIADLMARSYVVPAQPAALPEDREELADYKAARARSIRNVVIAELVIIVIGLGAPWLLTRKTESTEQRAARLLEQKLEAQFKADPANQTLARDLTRSLWAMGKNEEAAKVSAQHEAALSAKADARLKEQLARLDANPGDEETFMAAAGLLEERGENDRVRVLYQKFIALNRHAPYRAGYGDWLMRHGFPDEAVTEMQALLKDEPDFEGVHKFLAQAYVMANRLPEAQEEYQRELVLDPEDEDAQGALDDLNAELGPLPKAKITALEKELKPKK